jgi:4-amino-4-deoxy-L-arabinose transferase-like glycosyltransferase
MKQLSPPALAALIIFLATVIRLCFAASMGLGIDESYMVAAAHRFHLSYFDHQPISWWMELAVQRLTGMHNPVIVRLPFIALFAGTSALMYRLTDRLFGPRAAMWAVVALTVSPVFSLAFGTWVLPDGPLDFFLLAAAWALSRAVGVGRPDSREAPDARFWALAGLFAGLAMTSKYNAALNLLGALAFLLVDARGRRALAGRGPWLACLIALAVFSPVLVWNAQHHWASFSYQGARATGFGIHPARPFIVWAGEALFVAPWIFVPMVLLLIGGLRRGADRRARFLALLGILPIVLFSAISFWSSRKILYHWAAPGYLMLLPLLGDWLSHLGGAARRWAVGFAWGTAAVLLIAVMFVGAELQFGIMPSFNERFALGKSPELQAIDWTSFHRALAGRGDLTKPHLAVAALRWYDAGKIAYAIGPAMKVTVFEGNQHEFGITTPPQSLIGDDILIAAMPGDFPTIMQHYAPHFASITAAKPIEITHHGQILLRIPMMLGHDLRSWPPADR